VKIPWVKKKKFAGGFGGLRSSVKQRGRGRPLLEKEYLPQIKKGRIPKKGGPQSRIEKNHHRGGRIGQTV